MRQVARRAGVQRGQEQKRTGLAGRDQFSREFAREVKAGIEVDRAHLLPGRRAHGESVIGLAPRGRSAVNEMGHPPEGGLRGGQQRVARGGIGEVADPGHGEFRPGRVFRGSSDRIRIHVGEHRAHALADQGLGDGAADAVSRAGDQGCLARRIERIVQEAHVVFPAGSVARAWLPPNATGSNITLFGDSVRA